MGLIQKIDRQDKSVQPEKTFHVLDLASDGGRALRAYGESYNGGGRISIKAIGLPEYWGFLDGALLKKVKFDRVHGLLPECLHDEPSGHYHHVQFHMLADKTGKVGHGEAVDMMNSISRILKEDGVLFLSADLKFFCKGFFGAHNLSQEQGREGAETAVGEVLHRIVSEKFDILAYFRGDVLENFKADACGGITRLFGFKAQEQTEDVRRNWEEFADFFARFSRYSANADYFAIAIKKPQESPVLTKGGNTPEPL